MKQPVVLVLDDLHWADAASLELVSHLFRRPPDARVVLAVGFRAGQTGPAVGAVMDSALRSSDSVHSIRLGPLAPADAEALMGIDDPAEAECVYRRSGGNPFYMLELPRPRGGERVPGSPRRATTCPPPLWRPWSGSSRASRNRHGAWPRRAPWPATRSSSTSLWPRPAWASRMDWKRSTSSPRRDLVRSADGAQAVPLPPSAGAARGVRGVRARGQAGRPRALRQRARGSGRTARHARPSRAVRRPPGRSRRRGRAPRSRRRGGPAGAGQCGPLVRARARPPPRSAPREDRVSLLVALAETEAAVGRFEQSRRRCWTAWP